MNGLIVSILFASIFIIFVLFAYWTFSKIFTTTQARGESLKELEEKIVKLEERIEILEGKLK